MRKVLQNAEMSTIGQNDPQHTAEKICGSMTEVRTSAKKQENMSPKGGKLKWWQKDEIKYWNWTKWDVKLNKSKNHETINEWIF